MLDEAMIIARFKGAFPSHIGDDAAVVAGTNKQLYVVTKDLLVEDIHFRTSYYVPSSLAHKALHANLSDIAAMGATPQFILCGIAIPPSLAQYAEDFLNSLTSHIKNTNLVLIGGDTVRSPDKLFISITAIGSVQAEHIKHRSTAQIGDFICVAGNLGHAHLGLMVCEQSLVGYEEYKHLFLDPQARLSEGLWLAKETCVTSMMDISDGLFIDLHRLCEASNVAGDINLELLLPSPSFVKACIAVGQEPMNVLLTGGEDYSLLFTVKSMSYNQLAQDFMKNFGYEIKHVGYIIGGAGVSCTENGKPVNLNLRTFAHFRECHGSRISNV